MKTTSKLIIFLSGLVTGILCLIAVIWLTDWHNNSKAPLHNPAPQPIPLNLYGPRLVPLDIVKQYKTTFTPPGNSGPQYDGGIIRDIDVLLSLGLNNDSLYQQLINRRSQHVCLKITMGVNSAGTVKMYAHPVLVDESTTPMTVIADVYFDQSGNLWNYNNGNPIPFNLGQSFISVYKPAGPLKAITSTGGQLNQIDLNNPCPPCSP